MSVQVHEWPARADLGWQSMSLWPSSGIACDRPGYLADTEGLIHEEALAEIAELLRAAGCNTGDPMTKKEVRTRIAEIGIVPAIRVSSAADARFAVEAISDSGIPIAKVTMTTRGAIESISDLARDKPELIVGAGTIVDLDTARRCLDAGARFLTSPGLDIRLVEFALMQNVVVMRGALTPSEIMAAWQTGPDFVKVFPCSVPGGARYLRGRFEDLRP